MRRAISGSIHSLACELSAHHLLEPRSEQIANAATESLRAIRGILQNTIASFSRLRSQNHVISNPSNLKIDSRGVFHGHLRSGHLPLGYPLVGAAADDYVKRVLAIDLDNPGTDSVFKKIRKDLMLPASLNRIHKFASLWMNF